MSEPHLGARPGRGVVHEDKFRWPTRGPNVARTTGSPMRGGCGGGRKVPANYAVRKRLSSGVVTPDSACHAGGRGFESRRSRFAIAANACFLVPWLSASRTERHSGTQFWNARLRLPPNSYALYELARRVAPSRIRRGDVLFFWGLGHVGIYVERGRMIHAPQSGRSVEVVSLGGSSYGRGLVAARRLVGASRRRRRYRCSKRGSSME